MSAVNEPVSTCALPATVQHAYRMGGPVSSLSYSLPLQVLLPRWNTHTYRTEMFCRVKLYVHHLFHCSFHRFLKQKS